MALTGSLGDISLVNLISMSCNERNQARLIVRNNNGVEAVVYFSDGQIVHASLGTQEGEEVIYEVLGWGEGEFALEQGVGAPKNTVIAGWSGMLLKGLSRIDESKAGLEVSWDEGEGEGVQDKGNGIVQRMVKALQMIDGIAGALMCSRTGEVLGQDTSDALTKDAALVAFVGRRIEALGGLMKAGVCKQVVLVGARRRMMLLPHKQDYVGMSFALRTSVESLIPVIQMTVRRYR